MLSMFHRQITLSSIKKTLVKLSQKEGIKKLNIYENIQENYRLKKHMKTQSSTAFLCFLRLHTNNYSLSCENKAASSIKNVIFT